MVHMPKNVAAKTRNWRGFILARTAYPQRRKAFLPEPATKVAEVFEFCFKGQA
jgi:hypothetical protein